MSNEIFPSFAGIDIEITKTPIFSTAIQTSVSGRELRAGYYVYPRYAFDLSINFLYDAAVKKDLESLIGFYNRHRGALDSFLIIDPTDNTVVRQLIGYGDSSTTAFQLKRSYGGFIEPTLDIQAPDDPTPIFNVYFNDQLQDPGTYTVDYTDSGVITFNDAPYDGYEITISFSYYYRVRFAEYGEGDAAFKRLFYNLWENQKINLITVR